jgi:hypothetical protein
VENLVPIRQWSGSAWEIALEENFLSIKAKGLDQEIPFDNSVTLGAQITVDGHHASIDGIPQLSGAPVEATDIRAGAGLVLAALVSEGETTVDGAFHIDRGYPNFAEQLVALGASVTRG